MASIGEFLDAFGFENMLLIASFMVSFVLINFIMNRTFRNQFGQPNKAVSGITAFVVSMLIVFGVHTLNIDLGGFLFNIGLDSEILETIITFVAFGGLIFLAWKVGLRKLLFFTSVLLVIIALTGWAYESDFIMMIGFAGLGLWFIWTIIAWRQRGAARAREPRRATPSGRQEEIQRNTDRGATALRARERQDTARAQQRAIDENTRRDEARRRGEAERATEQQRATDENTRRDEARRRGEAERATEQQRATDENTRRDEARRLGEAERLEQKRKHEVAEKERIEYDKKLRNAQQREELEKERLRREKTQRTAAELKGKHQAYSEKVSAIFKKVGHIPAGGTPESKKYHEYIRAMEIIEGMAAKQGIRL